jgi:hypothetical protein
VVAAGGEGVLCKEIIDWCISKNTALVLMQTILAAYTPFPRTIPEWLCFHFHVFTCSYWILWISWRTDNNYIKNCVCTLKDYCIFEAEINAKISDTSL